MSEKMISEQELRWKRVYEFYLANKSEGKMFTIKNFEAENIPKRTIYTIMARAESESGYERVAGSGRIAKKMNKTNITRLKAMFDHGDRVSQRQAGRKFGCTHGYISKTLKKKTSIRCRKKKTIPKRTEQQREKIRTRCGRLVKKLQNNLCILTMNHILL